MEALSLSPFVLFEHAGWVGKAVMGVLGALSVYCWILVFELLWTRRVVLGAVAAAREAAWPALLAPVEAAGTRAAAIRLARESAGETRQRVGEAMERVSRALLAPAVLKLNGLAIVASAAPFIGLFGTVWGIVSAFSGMAIARENSLSAVAPGLAEALAATAFGLLAAIPASVAYNRLGAHVNAMGAALADLGADHAIALLHKEEAP